ncbi:hypothetical protein FMUND_6440 [Fusarium mundagurra]|uniref:Uncharacterized protein n=1 Tax=Fusarium mundagurra TaxID=1567541 RepID=A0A8H6DG61_9HYPO|nr:hypothetical protein FMUND_6440 [Fusarium mundagurra]
MGSQEEQSLKRKSSEARMTRIINSSLPRRIGALRPVKAARRTAASIYRYNSEDDDDEATLKRETDAPVPPNRAQREQRPKPAEGTPGTTSIADITPLCLPGTKASTCAGCGSSSHRLNICMKAGLLDGLMNGCPWCNTLDHSLTNCPETKHDLAMQLEVIQMRANMPSFQPTQEWVDIVRVAVAKGHKPPNGFPWTAQFTKGLRSSLSLYQRGLGRVGFNNRKGLPIDPDTKDWETAQRKFPPFDGY